MDRDDSRASLIRSSAPRVPFELRIAQLEAFGKEDTVSSADREAIAEEMAAAIDRTHSRRYGEPPAEILSTLRTDGIVRLDELQLAKPKIDAVVSYLKSKPIYNGHVSVFSDGVGRSLNDPEALKSPFGSYNLADTVQAPVLLDLAFDPRVLSLAEAYLGCAPSLFSIHAWWSFPGHSTAGPQIFHRDVDDYRFLALFVYLTDVKGGAAGGEHEFICSTQTETLVRKSFPRDPGLASEFFYPRSINSAVDESSLYKSAFGDNIRSITGAAGSVFLADTYALHRGVRPTEAGRLVCWIRYGLRKNLAYGNTRIQPVDYDWKSGRIPNDEYHHYMARLLLGPPIAPAQP